jgi:hypothetical protein
MPNPYGLGLLLALNRLDKIRYFGTVPDAEIARRRARNKTARKSRRINRKAHA